MILSQLLAVVDAELPCSEAAVAKLEFGESDLHSTESRVPWEAACLVSLREALMKQSPEPLGTSLMPQRKVLGEGRGRHEGTADLL